MSDDVKKDTLEVFRNGYKVVLENKDTVFDERKQLLCNAIDHYARMAGKEVRIVFFNYHPDGTEKGVAFYLR